MGEQWLRRRGGGARAPDGAHGATPGSRWAPRSRSSAGSCGYVGTTDGWTDLARDFRMDWEFDVAERRQHRPRRRARPRQRAGVHAGPRASGDSLHHATTTLLQSLGVPVRAASRAVRRAVGARVPPRSNPLAGASGRRRAALSREPQAAPGARGQDLPGRDDRLAQHPLGRGEGRRRPGRLPPRLDARHGEQRRRPPGLRQHRDAAPGPRLPRLLAAARRRVPSELLDRRRAVLARHPARRGGVPDPARLEAPRGRRAGRLRSLSDGAARRRAISSGRARSRRRSAGRRTAATRRRRWRRTSRHSSAPRRLPASAATRRRRRSSRSTPTSSRRTSRPGPSPPRARWCRGIARHYIRILPVAPGDPEPDEDPNRGDGDDPQPAARATLPTSRRRTSSTRDSSSSSAMASARPAIRSSRTRCAWSMRS